MYSALVPPFPSFPFPPTQRREDEHNVRALRALLRDNPDAAVRMECFSSDEAARYWHLLTAVERRRTCWSWVVGPAQDEFACAVGLRPWNACG